MKYFIVLLILSISLLPRIPLPVQIPLRRFDLRIEDLIIVLLFCILLMKSSRKNGIYVSSLFKPASIYFTIAGITSVIALIALPLDEARTMSYLVKEIEYFVLFLIVINFVRTKSQLHLALRTLMIAGFINMLWVGYQVVVDKKMPLFVIGAGNLYEHPTLLSSYGPTLIGEASPFATGTFFMIMFLLTIFYLLFFKWKWTYVILNGAFLISLILSASRSSIFGAFIGLAVFISLNHKRIQKPVVIAISVAVLLIVFSTFSIAGNMFSTERVLDKAKFENSMDIRQQDIWMPLLPRAGERFIFGWGKGSIGFLPELTTGTQEFGELGFGEEAHNNYLKLLLETGVFGLLAFLWLLYRIINLTLSAWRQATDSISKVITSLTLVVTIAMTTGALVQDVFKPVISNELWWLLIGLTVVGWRINARLNGENAYYAAT